MSGINDFVIKNGELKKYKGNNRHRVVIPKGVKVIGTNSFYRCYMEMIRIPDSVISIGRGAFSSCAYLASVTIPDSVTNIGAGAFSYCRSLTTITLPNNLTRIGEEAFSECRNLNSINIPDSVKSIGEKAFYGCGSLKSIKIPESVKSIGMGAFAMCENLSTVEIPQTLKCIDTQAFFKCNELADETGFIIVNDVLFGRSTDSAHVTIPDGVRMIGGGAFYSDKNLVSVTLPESVKIIGESAFENCQNLATITIPSELKHINENAFLKCANLKNILMPEDVKEFDGTVFDVVWKYFSKSDMKNCMMCSFLNQLPGLAVGDEVIEKKLKANKRQIVEYAIKNDDAEIMSRLFDLFKKIELNDLEEYIENVGTAQNVKVFLLSYRNKKYTAEIQDKYECDKLDKELGFKARTFTDWKKIYNFKINGNEVTITGYRGSETEVFIPETIGEYRVVAIDDRAFSPTAPRLHAHVKELRKNIQTIIIPNSVRTIGDDVFYDCSNLTDIVVSSDSADYTSCDGVLFDKGQTTLLWYPMGKQDVSYVVPETVTIIGDSAFSCNQSLNEVVLPQSITHIGDAAFYWCQFLKNVKLPDGISHIGNEAFCGCVKLASATLPDTVSFIGAGAFKWCENISSVTLPENLEAIGVETFKKCKNLWRVKIPDGVKTIGAQAFCFCSDILKVEIPASVTSIGERAFFGCRYLTIYANEGSFAEAYARENNLDCDIS